MFMRAAQSMRVVLMQEQALHEHASEINMFYGLGTT